MSRFEAFPHGDSLRDGASRSVKFLSTFEPRAARQWQPTAGPGREPVGCRAPSMPHPGPVRAPSGRLPAGPDAPRRAFHRGPAAVPGPARAVLLRITLADRIRLRRHLAPASCNSGLTGSSRARLRFLPCLTCADSISNAVRTRRSPLRGEGFSTCPRQWAASYFSTTVAAIRPRSLTGRP
jgi:hypothetical protein